MYNKYLRRLDRRLFHGLLEKLILKLAWLRVYFRAKTINIARVFYSEPVGAKLSLHECCNRFGSDKGGMLTQGNTYPWASHNYVDVYSLIFNLVRKHEVVLVECGIGTNKPELKSSMGSLGKPGASLRVWEEFFPKGHIFGLDIDASVIFSEGRIECFQSDQTDKESVEAAFSSVLKKCDRDDVDIIIDDGLHTPEGAIKFFDVAWKYLSSSGIYIIEDVRRQDFSEIYAYLDSVPGVNISAIELQRKGQLIDSNRMFVLTK